jgi:putative salt-induced outer membrane protein YdiY
MMIPNRQLFAAIAISLVATSTQAAWKGKGEAGIVFARGNSTADTVNLKLGMSNEIDNRKHSLEMAALRATS